ncbi:hypothetical protein ZWY2020_018912 [Hordeum vulgare]|nr:hypothetical protein ZWY2020_018912 [Hordeum vulgare]
MVPILQEVHEKLSDKINIVKIDTEKYTSIANKYKIEALPTFIIFKDTEPCYRFVSFDHISPFVNGVSAGANEIVITWLWSLCLSAGIQEGALPADQLILQIESALEAPK